MFLFNGEFCEFYELGGRRLIGGELLEKLAQVGRVLRGSGGWLVILVGERWFA